MQLNRILASRLAGLVACAAVLPGANAQEAADTIYFGGPIVTMIKDADRVDARCLAMVRSYLTV